MKRVYLLMIACVLIFAVAGCQVQTFYGSRTGDEKQFLLEYSFLNKTETHEMALEQGTAIHVGIEHVSGRIDVIVSDALGKEIYRGNEASSGNFLLEIPETGTYRFSVTGKKAKGSVSFIVEG